MKHSRDPFNQLFLRFQPRSIEIPDQALDRGSLSAHVLGIPGLVVSAE